jgi:NhaP-type Na+/H+ or K+/H+ antiporter
MLPVGIALVRTRLPVRTVAFIGWFGPRGLASIIFAVIALEELQVESHRAVAVIGMTVLLSVFAHGLSAKPLANRYGATVADTSPAAAGGETPPQMPVRGLLHRHPAADTTRPGAGDTG